MLARAGNPQGCGRSAIGKRREVGLGPQAVLAQGYSCARPFTPKLSAWLLTLALPSMLVIPDLLGHNSLGMLPFFLAWGAAGVQLLRIVDRPSARQYVATRHSVGAAR
jgi:hypothetical protein